MGINFLTQECHATSNRCHGDCCDDYRVSDAAVQCFPPIALPYLNAPSPSAVGAVMWLASPERP